MRATHSSHKPHNMRLQPTTTSYLHRNMKFLPKPNIESPVQRYTGVAKLENYIYDTKQSLVDNLQALTANNTRNLSHKQQEALNKMQHLRHVITIKPADKNLGVAIMNTEDYITQCMAHLTDHNTYRLATHYPIVNIKRELQRVIDAFKAQLDSHHKQLYPFLRNGPRHPRTPQFYGIIKKFTKLPPMRPIVSQTMSILSPTASFLDHVLQALAQSYPDYVHNSTTLSVTLQDLTVPDHAILVSIDVENLYPSIPQSQCLKSIYTEICNNPHLFTVDPNLIIQLLHVNINYNYFNFAHSTFQQIRGTAMGAAFSPTIANIFMSTIMRAFLHTQVNKPLILTRYIDDIFLIWTKTEKELYSFLTDLNSFHPNLRFTHEHSLTSIDFLDLTIFKGPQFAFTNLLDTKTFQKPLNLYQYLHFSSSHPKNVFKSIIRGECIRYIRTNTTFET